MGTTKQTPSVRTRPRGSGPLQVGDVVTTKALDSVGVEWRPATGRLVKKGSGASIVPLEGARTLPGQQVWVLELLTVDGVALPPAGPRASVRVHRLVHQVDRLEAEA